MFDKEILLLQKIGVVATVLTAVAAGQALAFKQSPLVALHIKHLLIQHNNNIFLDWG